jgi:hypothetical protein
MNVNQAKAGAPAFPGAAEIGMATLGWLLGADGNSLVFSPAGLGPITMQWFNQREPVPSPHTGRRNQAPATIRPTRNAKISVRMATRNQRTPNLAKSGNAPNSALCCILPSGPQIA